MIVTPGERCGSRPSSGSGCARTVSWRCRKRRRRVRRWRPYRDAVFLFVDARTAQELPVLVEAWREVRRHHASNWFWPAAARDFRSGGGVGAAPDRRVADESCPALLGARWLLCTRRYTRALAAGAGAMQCGAPVIASRAWRKRPRCGSTPTHLKNWREPWRSAAAGVAGGAWGALARRAREFSWERTAA